MTGRTAALAIAVVVAGIATVAMHWRTDSPRTANPGTTNGEQARAINRGEAPAAPAQRAAAVAASAERATNPDAGITARSGQDAAGEPVALQFLIQQTAVKPGSAVDIIVSVDAKRPLKNIAFDIAFDAALLRLRSAEEIDYANDAAALRRGRFVADNTRDGMIALTSAGEPLTGRSILAVAQFEATGPGTGSFDVSNVRLVDATGRPVPYSITASTLPVAIK